MNEDIKNTAEPGSIDALRESIVKEQRFKSSFKGYNKDEVNEYLNSLKKEYCDAIDLLDSRCAKLEEEKALLIARLEEQEAIQAELRNAEKRKREAEESIQGNLVESLRASNQKLQEENRVKLIETAALNEKLEALRRGIDEECAAVKVLCGSLQNSLRTKLAECDALVEAWSGECSGVISEALRQSNEAE